MKKSAVLVASAMVLASANANADAIGVYIGAQAWDMAAEGSYADNQVQDEFVFEDESESRFYIELEHPVPFIPNFKVAQSGIEVNGVELSSIQDVALGATNIDISYTDYTLYYELFDNGLFSFDFGLTGKDLDGEFQSVDQAGLDVDSVDAVIPMLYVSAEVGLPLTGLSAFAEGNFLSFDGHTLSDYQAGIAYAVIDNMVVDVDLQLGYRAVNMELDDLDGIYSDLKFDGAFAGVEVHF
ncbi:TIGR04219 family outer membrane beta-barrel protein [Thalassotalea ponticola]|uniref:TIGR04219 family outer membrane beta-barrel protein n=1 Tax=Thalassotalea ponticola TaxID=1523392 RepID=UPI0025B53004|nr:TIGR04219 family outer membrane beta-barrel protein [Thalassotalea ponticola]MDN3653777.1 TIGR04219 family outer membrane beta-barrel protein [Thalassotalea ponticola]